MFCLEFLNNLQQLPKNNPWPTHLTNQNYETHFHKHCDFLLKFQVNKIINKLILLWKWPRNISNVFYDAYETPIFAYRKKLAILVLTNSITKSNVEEESSSPYLDNAVMDLDKQTTNLEDTTLALHHSLQRVPTN
jgi:hypothetical protein